MRNIIVRIRGGLGNQLFIYAYARFIQDKFNNAQIYFDIDEYKKYKLRSYDLQNFEFNSQIKDLSECKLSIIDKLSYTITRKIYHLFFYVDKKYFSNKNKKKLYTLFSKLGYLYNENEYYQISTVSDRENVFIYGYFQDRRYSESIYLKLVNDFKLNQQLSNKAQSFEREIKKKNNTIAVSIRCGDDYIKLGWPICSINYYKKGIGLIKNKYPNSSIFIFADEIDKVKNSYGLSQDVIFIDGCKGYESLYLMSLCDHFIIANSSFSWWGSYLSQSPNKMVVAPTQWFPNSKTKDTGLYLDIMTLVDNNI